MHYMVYASQLYMMFFHSSIRYLFFLLWDFIFLVRAFYFISSIDILRFDVSEIYQLRIRRRTAQRCSPATLRYGHGMQRLGCDL